ncbi:MAG: (Fe-S)-binding protein [Elusimicrobiota bacterium]|nr:(Fe-S)-binding protein [Elusimicrobiota bacterium]
MRDKENSGTTSMSDNNLTDSEEQVKTTWEPDYDQSSPGARHFHNEVNELYPHESADRHLGALLTDLGERNLYDAAAQCNRCGYCETSCPTYMLTGRETISARGRNQFVRMLVEGQARDPVAATESLSTCLLCGACSSACYAKVPTPDIVLEGRRALTGYGEGFFARAAVGTLLNAPRLFAFWLKLAYLAKMTGLPRLAARMGLYDFIGMPGLAEAESAIEHTPLRFASEILRRDQELKPQGKRQANWAYFAACGPNFVFTEIALATVRVLKKNCGDGVFTDNLCCGLMAHNYGRLGDAREFARRNIARYEELKAGLGEFPVIADCSSCAAFMKSYEQLFTGDEEWRPRARAFAAAVKDILEFIPPEKAGRAAPAALAQAGRVTYHDSCRAAHGQGLRAEPRAVLRKLAGEQYRELPESDWCCGGAGAFAFTQPEISRAVLDRKLRNIASVQADTVVVGATSCLAQINAGLREAYPSARAVHYSVFLDEVTREDGQQ